MSRKRDQLLEEEENFCALLSQKVYCQEGFLFIPSGGLKHIFLRWFVIHNKTRIVCAFATEVNLKRFMKFSTSIIEKLQHFLSNN